MNCVIEWIKILIDQPRIKSLYDWFIHSDKYRFTKRKEAMILRERVWKRLRNQQNKQGYHLLVRQAVPRWFHYFIQSSFRVFGPLL